MCVVDGTSEAYFRGRKLKGREVKVPEGYTGTILSKASTGNEAGEKIKKRLAREGGELEEEEEEDEEEVGEVEEVQALEEMACFDKIVLWGHERMVEGEDPFVKGVEEWIGFAEAVSFAF